MYAGPSKLHKKHSYRSQKVSGPLLSTCLPPAQSSELPLYSNLAPTTKALKETQNRVLQRHHHNIPKPQQAMCTNLSFFAIEVLTYIFIEKLPDLVRGFTGQQVLDGFWAALLLPHSRDETTRENHARAAWSSNMDEHDQERGDAIRVLYCMHCCEKVLQSNLKFLDEDHIFASFLTSGWNCWKGFQLKIEIWYKICNSTGSGM